MSNIPKIIHHTWIGKDPLPVEAIANRESWMKHHPDWSFRIWTRENLPALRHQALYEASENTGHRADILRYELMYQFGGIYADIDVVCQKNFEPLMTPLTAFTGAHATRQDPTAWWSEIALLGSSPGHPFYGWLLEELPAWYEANKDRIISERTGPAFFGTKLREWKMQQWRLSDEDVVIFPPSYFYPYTYTEKHLENQAFPDAYSIHRWWGTWTRQAP